MIYEPDAEIDLDLIKSITYALNVLMITVSGAILIINVAHCVPMALESKMDYASNAIKLSVCNVPKIIQFVRNAPKEML